MSFNIQLPVKPAPVSATITQPAFHYADFGSF